MKRDKEPKRREELGKKERKKRKAIANMYMNFQEMERNTLLL